MDYLKGPEIADPVTSHYKGKKKQPITVTVVDNFRVVRVTFFLYAADRTLLEQGPAKKEILGNDWTYWTKVANLKLRGTMLRIEAEDLPGNRTVLQTKL
ncbi:hypothetical protein [Flavihumibacter petaseus]|uniref:Uncharacterized protein n=1 Tax=Flavihumibacter petaseus NBRC 106054 TaxID=1220578 RepID=A0A0E9MXJ4_9BACT|nr:hypothetical protein [Flavihumibacter petaseus]GAO42334.1 hypothetical protein FPE01S_01_13480 [Flavihumibacter petaseus NBRC 106054]